ncbi:anti-sigma factor [Kamptonema sp. UHCC 0994]|uniref:anti-sigma factor n=1 Tax=Kamptonema sp. UHCC 0994 TaxID=3031329 RepID=UPI0023B8BE0B|nr:anti-sigma factor [Kamptonema sp. UHCC 0994]MDF0553490.1 anti-sigma factor [Kamptonema sp. UHCC 0994]
MTEPLFPEPLEDLMAGYVLGNLSSEEAEELRRVLKENPELATEVASLQEVLEVMPYALPDIAVPPHLYSTIIEAASTTSVALPNKIVTANPTSVLWEKLKQFPLRWSPVIGSVAALLALAVGLDNYQLRQQITTLDAQIVRQKDVIAMLQQPNTHLVSLKGMAQASAASGSIVVTPGEPKAVLILKNLPVLPKGQFYQLWSVINDEKVAWEQFNTNEIGTVFVKLSLPTNGEVTTLVVTVEASPLLKNPSGPMVMTGSL